MRTIFALGTLAAVAQGATTGASADCDRFSGHMRQLAADRYPFNDHPAFDMEMCDRFERAHEASSCRSLVADHGGLANVDVLLQAGPQAACSYLDVAGDLADELLQTSYPASARHVHIAGLDAVVDDDGWTHGDFVRFSDVLVSSNLRVDNEEDLRQLERLSEQMMDAAQTKDDAIFWGKIKSAVSGGISKLQGKLSGFMGKASGFLGKAKGMLSSVLGKASGALKAMGAGNAVAAQAAAATQKALEDGQKFASMKTEMGIISKAVGNQNMLTEQKVKQCMQGGAGCTDPDDIMCQTNHLMDGMSYLGMMTAAPVGGMMGGADGIASNVAAS